MLYDFDRIYNRKSTLSAKWSVEEVFGHDDIIPLWVADMDFPVAEPIVRALKERADHPIFGYTRVSPGLYESIINRLDAKFGWKIEKEWIVITPGVMPAVNTSVVAFTSPGDLVALQSPVYPPFWSSISGNGREVAANRLKLTGGRHEIDFKDLESKFRGHKARAMILCSPHNPGGRVWSKEELVRMGEIVISSGGVMIADEIHCELVMKGYSHTPFAAISKEFAMNSVTCFAPSKTFNVPGFHTSVAIIPNEELRQKFDKARGRIMGSPCLFGLVAMEAAFKYGDEWLSQAIDYIEGNIDYATEFFENSVPEIVPMRPEGTYLIWLDCRGLGLKPEELKPFFVEEARVGLNDGITFGAGGEGFMRLNVGCPRAILQEGLNRIEKAVKARRKV
ncbi:MAG: MalY/PatB family protein [Bacillota bacterium]|jgi:cystathionine beta-lyase